MKVVSKIIQCEIFYFILAWLLGLIVYLLINIFFWIDDINHRLADIQDKLNDPLELIIE